MTHEDESPLLEQVDALLFEAGRVMRTGSLACLRATGADRVDYLHRMLTQDIASLAQGRATYACLLTIKGRILGDLLVWNPGDHLLLEMPADALAAVQPVLDRYVIADDVTFEEVTTSCERVIVAGARAAAHLEAAGISSPQDRHVVPLDSSFGSGHILRFDRRGLPCFELHADTATSKFRELLEGLPACSPRSLAAVCTHQGIPRFGAELGEDVLFNEAGLEEAISWTKGCFPGQEPVVMAKHRGRPPRLLVQLALGESTIPARGAQVLHDGSAVGAVTSAASAVRDRGPVALAYVKHAFAEDGRVFDVDGAGSAVATVLVDREGVS